MGSPKNRTLVSPGDTTPSAPFLVADFTEGFTLQFIGIGEYDAPTIEVSNDKENPTNWSQVGEPVVADGMIAVEPGARWLRIGPEGDYAVTDLTVKFQGTRPLV